MAFEGTYVRDTFDRADSFPLNGDWTNMILNTHNPLQLTSSQVAATNQPGALASAWFTGFLPGADCEVWATYSAAAGGAQKQSVWGRLSSPGGAAPDGYTAGVTGGGVWTVNRWDNGVETVLDTLSASVSVGDRVGLRITGTYIAAWRYTGGVWTQQVGASDTTYTAAGFIGLSMGGTTARLGDFAAGNIGVATSPPGPMIGRARW